MLSRLIRRPVVSSFGLQRRFLSASGPHGDATAAPSELVRVMEAHGLHRAAMVYDEPSGNILCTHPSLEPVAEYVQNESPDFLKVCLCTILGIPTGPLGA